MKKEQLFRKAWEIASAMGKNLNEYITWALDESFKSVEYFPKNKIEKQKHI